MEASEEYFIYSAIIHNFLSDLLDTDPRVKHPFFFFAPSFGEPFM